jgi:ubiquinone/menaquinone biosynthesis C-methylase UbiE
MGMSTYGDEMDKQEAQDYRKRSENYFEKISSHYSDTFVGKYTKPMYNALMKELAVRNFETLLDVGCGTGRFLSIVLNEFDVEVSGIDISPGMIERSKELLGGRADLRVGDSEHLPWKEKSFDMVTCNASFHHYPNPELVLKEMRRVLTRGGSVIIADPWAPNPWRFFANFLRFNKGGWFNKVGM